MTRALALRRRSATRQLIPQDRRCRRAAFTLLEVILALALFVVIMGAVAAAIRLYYVNLTQSQRRLELTALARGTINLLANDLRSAIQFKPVDVSGLNELISSNAAAMAGAAGLGGTSGSGGTTGGTSGAGTGNTGGDSSGNSTTGGNNGSSTGGSNSGGTTAGGAGASGSSGGSSGTNAATGGSSDETASNEPPIDRPRLYGTSRQLVLDVSRLPRIDQYHPVLHTSEVGSYLTLPTDLKSVSYFVSFETVGGRFNGGLFRREVDRVALRQAGEASAFEIDAAAREVAPEVVDIAFRYFDGESWHSEWDSDTEGGFPAAIEFMLTLDPARLRATAASSTQQAYQFSGYNPQTMRVFRCVTHLPLAEILTDEQQDLAQDRRGGLQDPNQSSGGTGGGNAEGNNSGGTPTDGANSGGNNAGGSGTDNAGGGGNQGTGTGGGGTGGGGTGGAGGRGNGGGGNGGGNRGGGGGMGGTGGGTGGPGGRTGGNRGGVPGGNGGSGGRGGTGTPGGSGGTP